MSDGTKISELPKSGSTTGVELNQNSLIPVVINGETTALTPDGLFIPIYPMGEDGINYQLDVGTGVPSNYISEFGYSNGWRWFDHYVDTAYGFPANTASFGPDAIALVHTCVDWENDCGFQACYYMSQNIDFQGPNTSSPHQIEIFHRTRMRDESEGTQKKSWGLWLKVDTETLIADDANNALTYDNGLRVIVSQDEQNELFYLDPKVSDKPGLFSRPISAMLFPKDESITKQSSYQGNPKNTAIGVKISTRAGNALTLIKGSESAPEQGLYVPSGPVSVHIKNLVEIPDATAGTQVETLNKIQAVMRVAGMIKKVEG